MIRLEEIIIENFKSIKEIEINLDDISDINTKAYIFVGVNESGKSAILDAINIIGNGFKDEVYEDICFNEVVDANEYIDLYGEYSLYLSDGWKKLLEEKCRFPKELIADIEYIDISRNVYMNKDNKYSDLEININPINERKYILIKNKIFNSTTNTTSENYEVNFITNYLDIVNYTPNELNGLLTDNQSFLTSEDVENLIQQNLSSTILKNLPKVQIWKPTPNYLINNSINLTEFKENTSISPLLKNMFYLFGKKSNEEIKQTIDRALSKQEKRDELVEKMSECITKHINTVWKEHKIKLRVSINGDKCQVFIEDKDKKHSYYRMEQRSDGFKQFISLILSLSALNSSNKLENNIILIDEPEVHLHPSGVRYMRDELLKIAQKNIVIIATHSHYLIDTNYPKRHWIVSKHKSETTISQVENSSSIEDDKVLTEAFGLNLFKELIPQKIIIVEGVEDKYILNHCLKLVKNDFIYAIKAAKGASKSYGIASLLNEEKLSAFIIFDDDKEGKDNKKKIIDNLNETFNYRNVLTLKDILNELPKDCTLEDLMPLEFVNDFFNKNMSCEFNLNSDSSIISQIKAQNQKLREDKQKLDSLKLKISQDFMKKYTTVNYLKKDAELLYKFINKLIDIISTE